MKNLLEILLYPIPHYTRWGMYPQAAFIVACLFWFQYRPEWGTLGPGVAIAFLAVAAVIMAVRAEYLKHSESVVWILIAFALFFIEMKSISEDRLNHDKQQAEIRASEQNNFEQMLAEQRKDVREIVAGIQTLPDLIAARNRAERRVLETAKLPRGDVKRRAAILASSILNYLTNRETDRPSFGVLDTAAKQEAAGVVYKQYYEQTKRYYLDHFAAEAMKIYNEIAQKGVKLPPPVPSRCTDATNEFLMRQCADDLVM